jgi:hypothetical protein
LPAITATPTSSTETFEAFQHPYEGDSPDLLLSILDDYRRDNKPDETYNYSISMVQSSGTGKSRLVELIAQKRFTLLFNLREDVEQGEYSAFVDSPSRIDPCSSHTQHIRLQI